MNLIGLTNNGNTCYFNSAIQALLSIPDFRSFCIRNRNKHNLLREFESLFSTQGIANPTPLRREFAQASSFFRQYGQQDSHECLIEMIDVLQNILGKSFKLFDGQLATHLTCMNCKKERTTKESFIDLSVPLTGPSVLDSLRSAYGSHEILEDPIECEKCSASTKTFKTVTIAKLPKVLVISLISLTKTHRSQIDEILTISNGDNTVSYASYVLVCVVYHIGNFNGGHYYCNVRRDGRWFHIDDTTIHEIPSYSQNTTSAYVLVYEKASTIA